MELAAIYDYLHMVDGKRQSGAPPGLAVEASPPAGKAARGRGRDTLFVHLTLSSREPASSPLYQSVVEALTNAYFLSGGSVTAALRQAIRAANEHLMRHNLRVEGVDKQQGGVTCAALREEEVFIAQAGQTLAFIAHQGRLERLPPRQPGHVTPLGVGYGVDTRFYHSWVHPGDVLLLAETDLDTHSDEAISQAIVYEGITAGIRNLAHLAGGAPMGRSMLVEFAADVPAISQPTPAPPPAAAGPVERPARPAPRSAAPREVAQLELPQPAPEPPAEMVPGPRPAAAVDVGSGVRRVASGAVMGLARFTGGIGRVMGRLAEGGGRPRQAVKAGNGPSPVALAAFAVIIPVLVALIVVAVYLQRGRAAQFQDYLMQMDQETRLAQGLAGDPTAARPHWEQVIRLSDNAQQLRPANEAVLRFRSLANDALDILDQVTRLQVEAIYTYPSGSTPSALTVNGLSIYVLDSGIDRVYKHLLETDTRPVAGVEPETLLFKTQAVGEHAVGELVDIVWLAKSGEIHEDTASAIDTNGLLLRYRPSWRDVRAARLVLPAAWSEPTAIAVYGDRLYVLDSGIGQIWKYEASGGGYPEEPTVYVFADNEDGNPTNDVNLTQMIDMTIDRDGNLYLLARSGQVLKFFGGERKPFDLTDLGQPLVAPSAIFCSLTGLNPLFYIADPGSGRVVQTTPQGLFLAQYKAKDATLVDPFGRIEDLFVVELPRLHIYAAAGDSLIVASLE